MGRDLAFLIHFIDGIPQPLHTTTNEDRGGTCQQVNAVPSEKNLHYALDDSVVAVLDKEFGTTEPQSSAQDLLPAD
jgi:hypothetical protein